MPRKSRLRPASRRGVSPHARAVVFDMDGILVKEDAALHFFQAHGLEKEFWRQRDLTNDAFYGRGNAETIKKFAKKVNATNRTLFPDATAEQIEQHDYLYPGAVMKTLLHQLVLRCRQAGAPLHVDEMRKIGRNVSLMPGADKLIQYLKKHPKVGNRIYINTAAYQPIAEEVAARLGIPRAHVFGTPVQTNAEGHVLGMPGAANIMRFKRMPLREIIRKSRVPRKRMIAIGDSATDLDMLTAISIPGLGRARRMNPHTGQYEWQALKSRQGGIAIAHNPSLDMLKKIKRGGPLYDRGVTLSVFLEPVGEQAHPDFPNAVVVAARRLDRALPVFKAVLKSPNHQEQSRALAQLVAENQKRRTSEEQPIITFAHRELDPGQAEQIDSIRIRARGEVAEKTRRD